MTSIIKNIPGGSSGEAGTATSRRGQNLIYKGFYEIKKPA